MKPGPQACNWRKRSSNLTEQKRAFTRENLEATYVRRRRESWVDDESKIAADSRNGFQKGVVTGMIGMAVAGMTGGRFALRSRPVPSALPSLEEAYGSRIPPAELKQMREECAAQGRFAARPHHGPLRLAADSDGWQAVHLAPGRAAHGRRRAGAAGLCEPCDAFASEICRACDTKLCVEMCSGQAITRSDNEDGVPAFDREKCVYCGACLWNCQADAAKGNIEFKAGAGGLHSTLN